MRLLLFLFIFYSSLMASAQQRMPLKKALNLISEAKGITFTYEHQLVNDIEVYFDENEIKSHSISVLLTKVLQGTSLNWNAIDKSYYTLTRLTQKETLPSPPSKVSGISNTSSAENERIKITRETTTSSIVIAQKNFLQGYVKEKKNDRPLSMASVQIKELGLSTMTDEKGHYIFRNLIGGKITVSVHFLTMVGKEQTIMLSSNGQYQMDFELEESILALKEVEVVATENRAGGATSSLISQKAIEHLQATSLADVLQLLPGGLAGNPDFSNVNKAAIRQINATNMGSLGTAVVINGAPLSNNANLQVINPGSSGANASFSTSTGSGTDLRQISADNIESIEIIRGVPSVEYGDLTNGAILVKTKAGHSPFQLKARVNPVLNQLWLGKGFSLGKKGGNLNTDLDYTKSFSDPRFAYDAYNRLTGSVLYSNTFFKERPFHTSTGFSYAMNLDELKQDPDDAKTLTQTRARDNAYRFHSNGRWNLNKTLARVLQYTISTNYAVQKGYQQSLISNYIYPLSTAMNDTTMVGRYVPSEYLSKVWVEGKPFNLFAKLTNSFFLKTGKFNHRILLGAEWRTDANKGAGKSFDQNQPPRLTGSNAIRPFSYENIPALNQLALYMENRISGYLFYRPLTVQIGLRYDNIQPSSLVKSDVGTVLAPRFNIGYQLSPRINLRGGFGTTAKAPTLLYLYPQEAYFDLLNFNYFAGNPEERLLIVTTRKFNTSNTNLTIATNKKTELGLDYNLFDQRQLRITLFREHIRNGYDFNHTFQSSAIIPVVNYVVVSTPPNQPPIVAPGAIHQFFAGYNEATNQVDIKNKGIEFDLDLGRVEVLKTAFVFNGAWLNTKNTNTGYYIVKRQNSGGEPSKVPVYDRGRGIEYERLSTTLRLIHHIPQARLIVTFAAQTIWTDQNRYLNYQSIPVAYFQNKDGHLVWLSEEQRQSSLITDDNELNLRISDEYYTVEKWNPLWLFNLRLSKEIGRSISFSFFANNVLMDRPLEESNRWKVQFSRRNPKLFFGTELSIKF